MSAVYGLTLTFDLKTGTYIDPRGGFMKIWRSSLCFLSLLLLLSACGDTWGERAATGGGIGAGAGLAIGAVVGWPLLLPALAGAAVGAGIGAAGKEFKLSD
jgi:osmotically inducible lipoprotein OsmB